VGARDGPPKFEKHKIKNEYYYALDAIPPHTPPGQLSISSCNGYLYSVTQRSISAASTAR